MGVSAYFTTSDPVKQNDAVPDPKIVIAVDACVIAGCPFAGNPQVNDGASSQRACADAIFPAGHLLPLQKLAELRRPDKKQRRGCQRRKHADLRDEDGTDRKPMQKIAGCDSAEYRCRWGLSNLILALLITVADALLRVAQQNMDPVIHGQWHFCLAGRSVHGLPELYGIGW